MLLSILVHVEKKVELDEKENTRPVKGTWNVSSPNTPPLEALVDHGEPRSKTTGVPRPSVPHERPVKETRSVSSPSTRLVVALMGRGKTRPNTTVLSRTSAPHERILLYFTTFPSQQHLQFMQECWPQLIKQSTLLSTADVLVYLGGTVTAAFLAEWQAAVQHLPINATLRYDKLNPGYQEGAMRAMHEMLANGWWKGYDWVIRLNPDVLIYDESYLRALMYPPDAHVSAVLANCRPNTESLDVHTDFLALRPSTISMDAFADWRTFPNAENQATRALAGIVRNNGTSWVYINNPWDAACRIRGHGIWHAHGSCTVALREKPWLNSDPRAGLACPRPSWRPLAFAGVHLGGYVC